MFDYHFKAGKVYFVVENEIVKKISLTVNPTILKQFRNHFSSNKATLIYRNLWGSMEEIKFDEDYLLIKLVDNKDLKDNQLIIESNKFKNYL